jgi:integrase
MTKRVEAVLSTRTARLKLAGRAKPYFRLVAEGLHLGYRRSIVRGRAGNWLARRYLGAERYEVTALGPADDFEGMPASAGAMTFDEAQAAAKAWAKDRAAADCAEAAADASPTVGAAVRDYIEARKGRGARAGRDAELRLHHHVLEAQLADKRVLALTEADLDAWRRCLRRGGRASESNASPLSPATLARLLNDLRAALNTAARKARASADVLTTIREGLRAPEDASRAREKQVIADADVRRIVAASLDVCPDFGALVMILAATGARFGQVARLRVADFQPEAARVMVPTSAKGRGAKQATHTAVPLPADVVAHLATIAAGRRGHEPLLMHWTHRQVPRDSGKARVGHWAQTARVPWHEASYMARQWHEAVAAAELPADLTPYCLRHSSIVRGLRAGLPIRLVAAKHDTSAAMIEKHYSAFITDALDELMRRAVVPLAPAATDDLAAARARRAL